MKRIGVILAAGAGQRMGQPKALLRWCEHLFLEWMVAVQYLAGIRRIVVVCPPDLCDALSRQQDLQALLLELRERLSWEAQGSSGMGWIEQGAEPEVCLSWLVGEPREDAYSSFQRAWEHCRGEAPVGLLVGPVDQGPVPVSCWQTILQACSGKTRQIGVPVWQGQPGHPVWLGGELLSTWPTSHPDGLRGVIREHQHLVVPIPVETPDILRNINTPVLYDEFLQTMSLEDLFVGQTPKVEEHRQSHVSF